MVWIGRAGVIRLVATVAVGGYRGEVASDVAEVAGHGDVEAGQGELRLAVVERGRLPGGGGVAGGAGGGGTDPGGIGIGSRVVVLEGAGEAVSGGARGVAPG